jgi:hypothetical protein
MIYTMQPTSVFTPPLLNSTIWIQQSGASSLNLFLNLIAFLERIFCFSVVQVWFWTLTGWALVIQAPLMLRKCQNPHDCTEWSCQQNDRTNLLRADFINVSKIWLIALWYRHYYSDSARHSCACQFLLTLLNAVVFKTGGHARGPTSSLST